MALFVLATLFRQLGLDKHATEALLTRCRVVALSLSRYKKIVAFLKKFPRFFWRNNNYYAPDMMIITTRVFHTNQSSGLITNSSQWGWHKGKNILILAQQLLWFRHDGYNYHSVIKMNFAKDSITSTIETLKKSCFFLLNDWTYQLSVITNHKTIVFSVYALSCYLPPRSWFPRWLVPTTGGYIGPRIWFFPHLEYVGNCLPWLGFSTDGGGGSCSGS